MTTSKDLEIEGFDELLEALERIPERAIPLIQEAMENGLAFLHDVVAEYPPATEANQPGRYSLVTHEPMGYYDRGRGWWYPVMRTKTLGEKLGKRRGAIKAKKYQTQASRVIGYKLRRTSEQLGKKWKTRVTVYEGGVIGVLGTTVSYAEYVQGDKQARMHAARGWITVGQGLEEAEQDIIGFFEEAAEHLTEVW